MIKKFIFFLLGCILLAQQPAHATERNADVGFDNPSAWMLDPSSPNLWTVSGSKAHGNGAKVMQMLMQMNSGIKEGHKYRWSLTVSSMTHGVVKVVIGPTMTGTVAGSWVGLRSPINDNFTTANGIFVSDAASETAGPDGAFRIVCGVGTIANTDPVVYPGLKGRSHTHTSWGNTKSLDVNGSYSYWRANGRTTCGDYSSPNTPIDRAAYWMPSMLNGRGDVVRPEWVNQYYKGNSTLSSRCNNPADPYYTPGSGGSCVQLPTGLEMISGYNFATGTGGPSDNSYIYWSCEGARGAGVPVTTQHLKDFFGGGCALPGQGGNAPNQGGIIKLSLTMAGCWDGAHADSPNHRDHVAYGTRVTPDLVQGCPNTHPFPFAAPNPLVYFSIDQDFYNGKWHLSSDEMVAGMVGTDPGGTMHMDFTNAWSPTVLDTWYTYCINGQGVTGGSSVARSCAGGGLGDGTSIKDGSVVVTTGQSPPDPPFHYAQGVSLYMPTSKIGIGKPITANGTYSGEIIADADGRFGLSAVEDATGAGFDGLADAFSVTDITSGGKGPRTATQNTN
jgi:hypothetical protein